MFSRKLNIKWTVSFVVHWISWNVLNRENWNFFNPWRDRWGENLALNSVIPTGSVGFVYLPAYIQCIYAYIYTVYICIYIYRYMDPRGQIDTNVIRFTVQLFVFELPGPHVEYHETDVSSATQKLHNKSVPVRCSKASLGFLEDPSHSI